jgi:hypothetical protein
MSMPTFLASTLLGKGVKSISEVKATIWQSQYDHENELAEMIQGLTWTLNLKGWGP